MQGPVDEANCELLNHMVRSENSKDNDSFRSQKFDYRGKSGTCNVCSAPCSSCFHVNKVPMKSNDESAGENCAENMLADRDKRCEIGQPSEVSTVAGLNSTSDSFSENAVGKASPKTSNESASDDNVVHSKAEVQRVPEGHDDCLSCVTGTDQHANRKSETDSRIRYDRQRKICVENSHKVPPSSTSAGFYSQNSSSVEIPLSKSTDDVTELLKDKNTFSQASSEKYMSPDPNSNNVKDDKSSDTKDKLLEGSAERLDSLVPIGVSSDVVCGDPPAMALNSFEKNDNMEVETHTIDETDDSDIVEQDVKVCDICGDAGREDLLAICCKCSDGAEHTYCMREMLAKVPEGEWMCEECKTVERVRNERHEKIGRMDESEKNNSSGQASSEYINTSDAEGHRTKGYKKLPGKRLRDDADAEVSSIVKKPAVESIVGSPKTSNSSKTAALSREKSLKNPDKGRLQSSQHSTSDTVPVNDTTESASSASDLRVQKYRGAFSKSNSFNSLNSKPKVKLVDQVIIQRQKSSREHGSFRMKEGVARSIGKSMSFKSTSSHAESKTKMLSPRLSYSQDMKITENTKQRSTSEQQRSSRTEHPSINSMISSSMSSTSRIDKRPASRAESSSLATSANHHELKHVRTDGKSAALSRSSSLAARRNADLSSSLGEFRRPSIYSHSIVGISSANGVNNAEQKSNQTGLKEDSSSCSVVAERPLVNANESAPADLPWPRDLTYSGERMREFSGSRFSPTSVKSSRDESDNIKAAIEAAVLKKPGIYRKHRAPDDSSVSSVGCEIAQDHVSIAAGKNKLSSDAELPERSSTSRNLTADSLKQETVNNMKDPLEGLSSGGGDSVHAAPSSRDMHVSAAIPFSLKSLAIPEHEYIWQGSFEICRSGNTFDLRDGIQAHLSTCASPKVIEAANNLKNKIVLYEVPRLSTWPIQFQEHGVRDDNIALYFFAKDLESYDKIYKVLLDNMMKNDLALKGNVNGVELLIYPSNQLPDNSQRWNMLFFLWGVFKGKRESSLQHMPESLNQFCAPRDIPPAIMSLPETRCSFRPITEDLPESNNTAPMRESPASEDLHSMLSPRVVNGNCGAKISSMDRLDNRLDSNSSAAVQSDTVKQCQETRGTCQEGDISPPLMATRSSSFRKLDTTLDRQYLSKLVGATWEEGIGEGIISDKTCSKDEVKLRMDAIDLSKDGGNPLEEDREIRDLNMDHNQWLFNRRERTHPFTSSVVAPTPYAGIGQNQCDEACIETVNISNVEKRFFPLESQPINPWKMHGLEHERVPNLELALGAERKSPTRPLFINEEHNSILDETGTKMVDDGSACLSLSLSFPFPEKEQSTKPDPKIEQQREHVNTSMLLFGSLREN
ncbi:hypothetical protein BUALT_Bualt01G0091600 [Buddleja alternifolia]|uniref:AIPP2-like SPOC-like domain-containing protein n=1 Tax=Buddleja alternifolia TaxID=168488 RepID=A0AAV6YDH7_9LAMI|nr:hypothetical protein BUALT_Bualt01G0091600 [Buddleja alternifolia]